MNQKMSSLHNRLRPIYISDFSGNPQIFGSKGVLTRLFQRAANSKSILQSIIITGQSGTGKTALSRVYVQLFQQFLVQNNIQHQYSYDVKVIESYEYSKAQLNYLHNYTTINVIPVVCIEDFQVLNKLQQIYLIQLMKSQKMVLIATINESVYRETVEELRKHIQIIELNCLTHKDIMNVLLNAISKEYNTLAEESIDIQVLCQIALHAQGDARKALSLLELSIVDNALTPESALTAIQLTGQSLNHFDILFECESAIQKSINASDPQGSIFYVSLALQLGCDPLSVARRILVTSSEDIGLANPLALDIANSCYKSVHHLKSSKQSWSVLAETAIYLSTQPKNNSTYEAINKGIAFCKESRVNEQEPLFIFNGNKIDEFWEQKGRRKPE
ncbi:Recombination_factor protein RarA [Hexamita inflata]|uniref:Recombination factor protein RarA n=1 Tax=Hexamita inflata TaxID=28002 RepID=A0AA86PLZ2_9EUKA|nr:Recombination factor protein RarA [Hexamita inflata]